MAKPSNLQLRAVLFLVLLAGGECARIDSGVEAMLDADTMQDAVATIGTSSPVCDDMSDPGAALKRYKEKRAKILAVSDKVLKANCIASCPTSINEIKWRMKEFKSCTTALSGNSSIPAGLRSEMIGSQSSDSLQKTLMHVSTNLMTLMKKNGMFEEKDGCEFNPDGFKAEKAGDHGDMDSVRKAIFGDECGSEEKVTAYINSFAKRERTLMTDFMEKLGKMVQTMQKAKASGEPLGQEVADLEADMEDVGSSLLALDSEGALEDAEAAGFVGIIFLVLIIIFMIYMFWFVACWPVGCMDYY